MHKAITPVALIMAAIFAIFIMASVIAGPTGLRQSALDAAPAGDPSIAIFNISGLMWVMFAIVPLTLAFLMWGLRHR